MKVKLLRRAWKNLRLVQIAKNDYTVQCYEREYGWTGLRRGTLKEMLSFRHDKIRQYIQNHSELFENRLTVIC